MYRILAREYISKESDQFKAYYIEQVMEENIEEPLWDAVHSFEEEYEDSTTDITVLIKKRIDAWATQAGYGFPSTTFIIRFTKIFLFDIIQSNICSILRSGFCGTKKYSSRDNF